MGRRVGSVDGRREGRTVGSLVGAQVGATEGFLVGTAEGVTVGLLVVGVAVGEITGFNVPDGAMESDGDLVGDILHSGLSPT